MKKQESLASKLFDVLNVLLMIVLIIVMAYPMVYVFSASIRVLVLYCIWLSFSLKKTPVSAGIDHAI